MPRYDIITEPKLITLHRSRRNHIHSKNLAPPLAPLTVPPLTILPPLTVPNTAPPPLTVLNTAELPAVDDVGKPLLNGEEINFSSIFLYLSELLVIYVHTFYVNTILRHAFILSAFGKKMLTQDS